MNTINIDRRRSFVGKSIVIISLLLGIIILNKDFWDYIFVLPLLFIPWLIFEILTIKCRNMNLLVFNEYIIIIKNDSEVVKILKSEIYYLGSYVKYKINNKKKIIPFVKREDIES